jgi:DNA-directed RNA polymerase sigma subunit (sigma70/sigma32)
MSGTTFRSSPFEAPIGPYLSRLRRLLAIEAEAEYRLAKSWRDRRNQAAKDRLITSQLRLVARIAWSYRAYGVPFSKLINEGNSALLQAVRGFDPDRRQRLAAFVMPQIEAALIDYVLASWSEVRTDSATGKMQLFFRLCRRKAQLSARGEKDRGHRFGDAATIPGPPDSRGEQAPPAVMSFVMSSLRPRGRPARWALEALYRQRPGL